LTIDRASQRIDNHYPLFDLETSIEIARLVQQHGGEWTTEELLDVLSGGATLGGAQLSKVNAARFFGLLGTTSCSIATTLLARNILSGESTAHEDALQEAFFTIPLYRALYQNLNSEGGEIPHQQRLTEILTASYRIPAHRAELVAQVFLNSINQAGLLDKQEPARLRPLN
jgi:hypothetical protein